MSSKNLCYPFLKPCLLTRGNLTQIQVFLAGLAGLFLLGHLEIKFIQENTVFLARSSLRAFLLRIHEETLPSSVQWSSTNLWLRNFGRNSERNKQTRQRPSSRKHPLRTAGFFYITLPAVPKVL